MVGAAPPYSPKFKPGDRVRIIRENTAVDHCTYYTEHYATGVEVTLPMNPDAYDTSDNTWNLDRDLAHISSGSSWVNDDCFELVVDPDDVAAAIASITGQPAPSNPNIGSGTTHREISISGPGVLPDDCPPLTVITIGHPANEIFCIKVPDAKYAKQNRWRNVATGKLVDPEDFRAGWNFYPPPREHT